MSISGVKNNKCFEPVPVLKFAITRQDQLIPANTMAGDLTFQDDNISAGDVAIVNAQYSIDTVGKITFTAEVEDGAVHVLATNATAANVTVTFNVLVLAGASSE